MEEVKVRMCIQKITIAVLIVCFSLFLVKENLYSESPDEVPEEPGMLLPMDNYAEIEEEIRQLSEEITRKNMEAAKAAQGSVSKPGIIMGKVLVTAGLSDVPERHSGDTVVYLENVRDNNYMPVQKRKALLSGYIAYTKKSRVASRSPYHGPVEC